jgi:hypothetical protein
VITVPAHAKKGNPEADLSRIRNASDTEPLPRRHHERPGEVSPEPPSARCRRQRAPATQPPGEPPISTLSAAKTPSHRNPERRSTGGALRLIASQPGTPELSVLYRFRDPAEAAATLQLRAGDPAAVDWYVHSDRVRSGSREHMTEAAYQGWKADMLAGKVTLMAAATTAAVTGLSARARADRITAGQVEQHGVLLHDGNHAGEGDWIVTRHNDRRMSAHGGRDWVKNGDAWHVQHRHHDGSLTVRSLAHHGRVRLPAAYVSEHVELLYATTTHRAQGGTVDTAHPLITAGMTRENLYVLASRARDNTTLYVATHDLPYDEDDHTDRARTDPYAYAAREVLLNIIATEGAALSATETITAAQEDAGSLATLIPRYLHAARQHAEQRYATAAATALGDHDGAALTADPAWHAVTQRLYDAEADGWDPARLLAIVAAQRELGTADSIAEVLSWRLDGYLTAHPHADHHDAQPADPGQSATIPTRRLLPWVTGPTPAPGGDTTYDQYLTEAAQLIGTRITALAGTAIRHRPPWTLPLGQPPADLEAQHQWRRHVAIIAAYRDQHKVTTNDPRQVLGPYAEPCHAAHNAYWHAAASVLAARQLAGLDPPSGTTSLNTRTGTHLAAGIYRQLPQAERTAISNEMSARLGPLWFGNPTSPDEDAATQPAHAATLTTALAQRGHLTVTAPATSPQITDEPLEADLARRRPRPNPRGEQPRTPADGPGQIFPPRLRPTQATTRLPKHRAG